MSFVLICLLEENFSIELDMDALPPEAYPPA